MQNLLDILDLSKHNSLGFWYPIILRCSLSQQSVFIPWLSSENWGQQWPLQAQSGSLSLMRMGRLMDVSVDCWCQSFSDWIENTSNHIINTMFSNEPLQLGTGPRTLTGGVVDMLTFLFERKSFGSSDLVQALTSDSLSNLELWCKTCDIGWHDTCIHCIHIIIHLYIEYIQLYIYTCTHYIVYILESCTAFLSIPSRSILFVSVCADSLQALKSIVETWLSREVIEHLEYQSNQAGTLGCNPLEREGKTTADWCLDGGR